MTFSVSDVNTAQGLLYKGTASGTTSPYTDMSYRVGVANGTVTLQIKDGTGATSTTFTGPPIQPNLYYQLIIVKNTTSPTGNADSADPYAPPFDVSVLGPATSNGVGFGASAIPTQAAGSIKISNIAPNTPSATPAVDGFLSKLQNLSSATSSYTVTISIRTVNDDGSYGTWTPVAANNPVPSDTGLIVNSTGSAHLLIGHAYDDNGTPLPLGGATGGNIRDVYLFNTAIDADGITTSAGTIDIANANSEQLNEAGILGFWQAQFDPNGIVNNPYDETAVAISTNNSLAYLAPLTGHEFEGTTLYIDGVAMPLTLVQTGQASPVNDRLLGGYVAAQLQRRPVQAAGDQHLADGPPGVPDHRRHVRPAHPNQRADPRRLPQRLLRRTRAQCCACDPAAALQPRPLDEEVHRQHLCLERRVAGPRFLATRHSISPAARPSGAAVRSSRRIYTLRQALR